MIFNHGKPENDLESIIEEAELEKPENESFQEEFSRKEELEEMMKPRYSNSSWNYYRE